MKYASKTLAHDPALWSTIHLYMIWPQICDNVRRNSDVEEGGFEENKALQRHNFCTTL